LASLITETAGWWHQWSNLCYSHYTEKQLKIT